MRAVTMQSNSLSIGTRNSRHPTCLFCCQQNKENIRIRISVQASLYGRTSSIFFDDPEFVWTPNGQTANCGQHFPFSFHPLLAKPLSAILITNSLNAGCWPFAHIVKCSRIFDERNYVRSIAECTTCTCRSQNINPSSTLSC